MAERLVLIDGHAILHRAFHALPSLATSKGQPTGAVFGFFSMLLRVISDLKPKYLIVAFDLPQPTFRQKLYPSYQSQRPEMAQELASQVDLLHRALTVMGIPIFEKAGYEADDLIGTIATKVFGGKFIALRSPTSDFSASDSLREKTSASSLDSSSLSREALKIGRAPRAALPFDLEVFIVTGDRDMLQLVEERVKVYAPIKGITQTILYDEKLVEEKYGLKPSQWVDYKALIGDPSDNYPGVTGVGPKTATDLLNKFGNLEKIYENLDRLPEKLSGVLTLDRGRVDLAKRLAQIDIDAPVQFNLEECSLRKLKTPEVEKLFTELEFKSLIARLDGENKNNKVKEKPFEKQKENTDQLKLI